MCVSPLNSFHKRKSKQKFIPKHITIYHVVHQFYCKFNHIPYTINHINSKSLAKLFYKVVTLFLNWLNASFSIFLETVSCFFSHLRSTFSIQFRLLPGISDFITLFADNASSSDFESITSQLSWIIHSDWNNFCNNKVAITFIPSQRFAKNNSFAIWNAHKILLDFYPSFGSLQFD